MITRGRPPAGLRCDLEPVGHADGYTEMELAASWPLGVPRDVLRIVKVEASGHRPGDSPLGALPTRRYLTVTCVTQSVKGGWSFPFRCATVNPDRTVGIQ